jgi:hypothetical protein
MAPSRLTAALASTALALTVLYLGVPRLVGGIVKLPGDHAISQIRAERPIASTDVATLAQSRERTLRWLPERKTWGELGLAHLLAGALRAPEDESRRPALLAAVGAIETGLALAPNDGYAWARLAIARYYLDGPSDGVADALTQSLLIAEYDRRLVFDRLDVAFAVWDRLSPETREVVRRQVGYGYHVSPNRLGALARTPDRRVRILAALSGTPERIGG